MNHSYQTWRRQKTEKESRIRAPCWLHVSPRSSSRGGRGKALDEDFEHLGCGARMAGECGDFPNGKD